MLRFRILAPGLLLIALPLILLLAMNVLPTGASGAEKKSPALAQATLGGGCFWCTEAVFESEPGVKSVTSGYAGGRTKNPSYEQICRGNTGHAEVIQIGFDPAVVTFERLLEIFWDAHDPTTLNR